MINHNQNKNNRNKFLFSTYYNLLVKYWSQKFPLEKAFNDNFLKLIIPQFLLSFCKLSSFYQIKVYPFNIIFKFIFTKIFYSV